MTDPLEVVQQLCERYQTAVSNNDSASYSRLFAIKRQMWNVK